MIKKNTRIREAIEEMKRMSLVRRLQRRYEEWEKAKRDRWAEDEFVRDQGRAEGLAMGMIEEKTEGLAVGKAEAILLILLIKGGVEADIRDSILKERDTNVLDDWIRAAATAKDADEFRKKMRWGWEPWKIGYGCSMRRIWRSWIG